MLRHLLRLIMSAGAFYFLIPHVPGAAFHGNFAHALLAGILFAIAGCAVEFLAIVLSTIVTITTLGMALFLLIPFWLFGFWMLPAVALRLVADMIPSVLSFDGWMPAILGGLVMLFIGVITSGDTHVRVRNRKNSRATV